ncbi:hypothetical protein FMEAI12_3530020 [Parafrankia sp. Ea1.12]|nr:hypothetical protein FMEAI12_3530020 [Parafrankia sp. Ea1.12]
MGRGTRPAARGAGMIRVGLMSEGGPDPYAYPPQTDELAV